MGSLTYAEDTQSEEGILPLKDLNPQVFDVAADILDRTGWCTGTLGIDTLVEGKTADVPRCANGVLIGGWAAAEKGGYHRLSEELLGRYAEHGEPCILLDLENAESKSEEREILANHEEAYWPYASPEYNSYAKAVLNNLPADARSELLGKYPTNDRAEHFGYSSDTENYAQELERWNDIYAQGDGQHVLSAALKAAAKDVRKAKAEA